MHRDQVGSLTTVVVFRIELKHSVRGVGYHKQMELSRQAYRQSDAFVASVRSVDRQRTDVLEISQQLVVAVAEHVIGRDKNAVCPRVRRTSASPLILDCPGDVDLGGIADHDFRGSSELCHNQVGIGCQGDVGRRSCDVIVFRAGLDDLILLIRTDEQVVGARDSVRQGNLLLPQEGVAGVQATDLVKLAKQRIGAIQRVI